MIFPGEIEAVKSVLAAAEQYGYGNLIAHLRRAWALKLMRGSVGHGKAWTYEQACRVTNSGPYPEVLPAEIDPGLPAGER